LISYLTILVLPSVSARLKHNASVTYQSIKTVNLFKTGTTNEVDLRQQQIYTRVYLVFYISSLSVLLFYTAVVERSISKTYLSPSIMDYEQLTDIYSDDVNCPCTHISILYSEFITELRVNSFHEACASDLIDLILTKGNYDVLNVSMREYFQLVISITSKCQEDILNSPKYNRTLTSL